MSFEVEFPLHASLVLCSDINVDNANKNKSRQLFVNCLICSHTERLVVLDFFSILHELLTTKPHHLELTTLHVPSFFASRTLTLRARSFGPIPQ